MMRFNIPAAWLQSYRLSNLRQDFVGALTVSAVVIPKAMACAVIAGLPVEIGLYTALATMLVYPLFGSSRLLSVTSTTAIAILTSAIVVQVVTESSGAAPTQVATTLALLVGAVLVVARLFRLGFLANFISLPVLVGFEAGVGIVIIISQLKYLLGVHVTSKSTVGIVLELPGLLLETHVLTAVLGLIGLGTLLLLPRYFPKVSAPLAWVVLSIIASAMFGFQQLGVESSGIVPAGLPGLSLPDLALAKELLPAALGIALLSFTETIASARTFSSRGDQPIDANQELFAIGAANIASALVGGMPAGGGTSQTAVVSSANVRSQMSQWINVVIVVICLLFLATVIGYLPKVALGALILVLAAHMIKPQKFRDIANIHKAEFFWALITLVGVVLIGTLEGILIAVVISLLTLLYQANHPPVYLVKRDPKKGYFRRASDNADGELLPGLLILRTEGRLTFANASNAQDKMRVLVDKAKPQVLILECSAIPDIEYTALVKLIEAEDDLRARGTTLWLAAVNPGLLESIRRSPLAETLNQNRMFHNLPSAWAAYEEQLGTSA